MWLIICCVDFCVFMCFVKLGVNILSVNFFLFVEGKNCLYLLVVYVVLWKNKEIKLFS